MIVLKSSYDKLQAKWLRAEEALMREKIGRNNVLHKYNKLMRRFDEYGRVKSPSMFTDKELRVLVSLCHPDKHSGSKSAAAMTAKLLKMR